MSQHIHFQNSVVYALRLQGENFFAHNFVIFIVVCGRKIVKISITVEFPVDFLFVFDYLSFKVFYCVIKSQLHAVGGDDADPVFCG